LKIFEGSVIYHPEYIYDFKLDCSVDRSLLTVHFKYAVLTGLRKLLCFAAVRQSNRILTDQKNWRVNIQNCLYVPFVLRFTVVQNKELFIAKFLARTAILKHLHLQRSVYFLTWGYTQVVLTWPNYGEKGPKTFIKFCVFLAWTNFREFLICS
jgi:hypothetical protein